MSGRRRSSSWLIGAAIPAAALLAQPVAAVIAQDPAMPDDSAKPLDRVGAGIGRAARRARRDTIRR